MSTVDRRYGDKTLPERRAERRERLMRAGLEAFGDHGYRAVSIEQLCAAAGVSTRNFYEEFGGREALLLALHDDLNTRALTAVVEAIATSDPADLPARVRSAVGAYFRVMTTDRRWARIALVETVGVSPTAAAHRQAAIDRFAGVIRLEADRLVGEGTIQARDFMLTSVALVGAITGLVSTWTADAGFTADVEDIADEAARFILLGLLGAAPSTEA